MPTQRSFQYHDEEWTAESRGTKLGVGSFGIDNLPPIYKFFVDFRKVSSPERAFPGELPNPDLDGVSEALLRERLEIALRQ